MHSLFLNPFVAGRRVAVVASCSAMLLALSSCSTITHYYTLSPTEPAVPLAASSSHGASVIAIGPVTMPDYVDRAQIVVRTSANEVKQATFDEWAGDLDDMVPRLLVENLAARLPTDHFVSFPQAGDLTFDFRVPILISRFDVSATEGADVVARWQVRGPAGTGTVSVRETRAHAEASGPSYAELVAALSSAMGTITDEIAAELSKLPSEGNQAVNATPNR